jgi:hypothetical protein
LLFFANFSNAALVAVLHSNKVILGGAALVALFSMFEYDETPP